LPFDVELHAGPAGCGPVAVTLNGRPLPFTRRGNPYRTGAAAVARAEFDAARVEGRNVLVIRVG
jgi:hypothetical protein